MDWMEEIRKKARRKNTILIAKDGVCLEPLQQRLEGQDRRAVVLWALELAQEGVETLEAACPGEDRPRLALAASWLWARGREKMRGAQRAILDCHAAAREMEAPEHIALCHGVGQACAVVHTPGHALGFPMYELTALVRRYGVEHCREAVEARRQQYLDRLTYWQTHWQEDPGPWAAFLCR